MKEFNLEEAKAGKPVCTRDGRPARIICWDKEGDQFPIVALVKTEEEEDMTSCTNEGHFFGQKELP